MIQRTTKTDVAIVTDLLDELAALTPDQIAEKMRGLGITAKKMCPFRCILAAYFERFGVKAEVYADATYIAIARFVRHPKSIEQFIANFDAGHYPELTSCPTHS